MSDNVYTIEELKAMIEQQQQEQQEQQAETKTVSVDGLEVTVDMRRLRSWKAARLLAKVDNPNTTDFQRMAAMMELYELIFADSFKRVLDHFGGEDVADAREVINFFKQLMEALDQKK